MKRSRTRSGTESGSTRRRLFCVLGAGAVAALAGCSGGGGGSDGGDGGGGKPTDTTEDSGGGSQGGGTLSNGRVASNPIDELKFESVNIEYTMEVTVANEGEQPTDLTKYTITLTVYDSEGNKLGTNEWVPTEQTMTIKPGKSESIQVAYPADESEVARFGISLGCGEGKGAYC